MKNFLIGSATFRAGLIRRKSELIGFQCGYQTPNEKLKKIIINKSGWVEKEKKERKIKRNTKNEIKKTLIKLMCQMRINV